MAKATKKKVILYVVLAILIIIILIPSIFIGMFIQREAAREKDSDNPEADMFSLDDFEITPQAPVTYSGYLEETTSRRYDFTPPLENGDLMRWIMVTLTWRDEEDQSQGLLQYTNEPDTFYLSVKWEGGGGDSDPVLIATGSANNVHGGEGRLELELLVFHRQKASNKGAGIWNITVQMSAAGDQTHSTGKVRPLPDDGNSYTFVIESEIYRPI